MIISKNIVLKAIFIALLLSFISNAHSTEKSIKVILYGDSLMAGYGLAHNENLSAQLSQKFKDDNRQINLINASASGNTSSNGLARLEWSLGDQPDIVILSLGANDMLRGIDPKLTQQNLDKIITNIKNTGAVVILAGMRSPENMGPEYKQQFDQIYPTLAQMHELIFMPFLLDGVALEKEYLQSDYKHPNAEGVRVMANNLYPFILKGMGLL
jgi:acyl-CoA thioesterase-1